MTLSSEDWGTEIYQDSGFLEKKESAKGVLMTSGDRSSFQSARAGKFPKELGLVVFFLTKQKPENTGEWKSQSCWFF